MIHLEMYCATDVGAVREINQDAVAIFPEIDLVVLADGMGGHNAGEIASRTAIEIVRDAIDEGLSLEQAVEDANKAVYELSAKVEEFAGMGTTLVAVQYIGLQAKVVYAGDSRLYRFRDHQLDQITVDQTLAQQMRDQDVVERNGQDISAYEHVLTNAIGTADECEITIVNEQMQAGDIHLICSDGLSGVLSDRFMAQCLSLHSDEQEAAIQVLLFSALRRSARDNVSVAIVYARQDEV